MKLIINKSPLILAIILWWTFSRNQTPYQKICLPPPENVITLLITNWKQLMEYSLTTLFRLSTGLCLGTTFGLICGIAKSEIKLLRFCLDPIVEIARPIPPVALTPFLILWFGISHISQVILITSGVFMIVCVSTVEACNGIEKIHRDLAKTIGLRGATKIRLLIFPAIWPSTIAALRIALASGMTLTVAAEYLGASGGLGYLIRNARTTLDTEMVLTAALLLGLISLFGDKIIRQIAKLTLSWRSNQ